MTLSEEIMQYLNQLDDSQQQTLLNFARILSQTPIIQGESGESIMKSIGLFDTQSLDEIETAIEEGCEQIDWASWE